MNSQARKERIEQLETELIKLKNAENREEVKKLSHLVGKCFKKAANEYQMITSVERVTHEKVEYWAIDVWWQKPKYNEFWRTSINATCKYVANLKEIERNIISCNRFKKKLCECTKHLNEMADMITSQNNIIDGQIKQT